MNKSTFNSLYSVLYKDCFELYLHWRKLRVPIGTSIKRLCLLYHSNMQACVQSSLLTLFVTFADQNAEIWRSNSASKPRSRSPFRGTQNYSIA